MLLISTTPSTDSYSTIACATVVTLQAAGESQEEKPSEEDVQHEADRTKHYSQLGNIARRGSATMNPLSLSTTRGSVSPMNTRRRSLSPAMRGQGGGLGDTYAGAALLSLEAIEG